MFVFQTMTMISFDHYEKYYDHFNRILDQTNNQLAPWNILYVDGKKNTSKEALEVCVDRLNLFLETDTAREIPELPKLPDAESMPLEQVDLTKEISEEDYDQQLEELQRRAGGFIVSSLY
jgi:hypothetical protein